MAAWQHQVQIDRHYLVDDDETWLYSIEPHYLLDGQWRQFEHWPDRSVKAELGEFGSVHDAKASLPPG